MSELNRRQSDVIASKFEESVNATVNDLLAGKANATTLISAMSSDSDFKRRVSDEAVKRFALEREREKYALKLAEDKKARSEHCRDIEANFVSLATVLATAKQEDADARISSLMESCPKLWPDLRSRIAAKVFVVGAQFSQEEYLWLRKKYLSAGYVIQGFAKFTKLPNVFEYVGPFSDSKKSDLWLVLQSTLSGGVKVWGFVDINGNLTISTAPNY